MRQTAIVTGGSRGIGAATVRGFTQAGYRVAFLYLERGFGIAAGSHAGYDVMVVALDMLGPDLNF